MKQLTFRLICFVLLITQLPVFNLAQTKPEQVIQPLEQGIPLEHELKGGEIHAYTFKSQPGQFVSIIVDQRGMDVIVLLFAPDGKQLIEVDSPNGSKGPEFVSFITEEPGNYRFEVRPLEKAKTGYYEVKIEAIRTATSDDIKQDKIKNFAAKLIFARTKEEQSSLLANDKNLITVGLVRELCSYAGRFRSQRNYSSALAVSRLALTLAEQIGDKIGVSEALYSIGYDLFFLKDYSQAMEYLQKCLALRESLGVKIKIANSLDLIGFIYREQNNLPKALEAFGQSLTLYQELGITQSMAATLFNIGHIHERGGNNSQALDAYQKTLPILEAAGNKEMLTVALFNLGRINFLQGDLNASLEYDRRNLKLLEETNNKIQTAYTLNRMSLNYRLLGDFANAMESVQKSFSISETLDNKELKAHIFMTYGLVHGSLGNTAQALEFYQRSLALGEEIQNKALIANALEKIGGMLFRKGNFAQAMENYQKCLKLNEEIGEKRQIIFTTEAIGNIHYSQGNFALAMEYYRKSLKLSEEVGNKFQIANTLIRIGYVYGAQSNYAQALEYAERAVNLSRQTGSRVTLSQALYIVGLANRDLKQFEKSRHAFEEAIFTIELSRASIAGQDSRATFFSTTQYIYELYIDLLMQMHREKPNEGYDAQALQISERARARSLLELLNESRTDINQGVMPELLERERLLQRQLNARAEQQTRLLSGQYTTEQAAALKKEIDALTFEYRNNQAQIRQKSPRYAALTQPQPLKLSEIQKEVLDADTILLEYALGEKRSYLWAVTKDSIKSYELPPRAGIETMVRRAYALLSDGKKVVDDKAQTDYEAEALPLTQILLAPVAAQIQNKRIVIVADGALQYLPFGALPSPNSKDNNRQPLIAENEIVSLSSASVLAVLRQQVQGRAAASKTVAVIADPVFSSTDARVKPVINSETDRRTLTPSLIKRDFIIESAVLNTGIVRNGIIQRLPFSRREAESIIAVAPIGGKMQALDFEAKRETALSPEMSQYRIVHFATHGLLNSEHPELSGIVLSLVNEQGQPVDGFLRLNEIYNLNLSADLVVLSACQTALGKEIKGEGLIGLTRGFMYAGSPRVVASLWKVDDVATAELMKLFYQKMLLEKMRPAAALRAAKVEMRKQKRWNAPFYWAAFEIQGEWR